MRRTMVALMGVVLVSAGLFLPAPPASAVTGVWTITQVSGTVTPVLRENGTVTISASCGSGKTAVSGFVSASQPDDVRRLSESFGQALGSGYTVTVQDQSGGAGTINVQAHARCVPTSYFSSNFTTAEATFAVDGSHIAAGTVNCPEGWRALGASTRPGGKLAGSTLLTFSPTYTLTGFEVRGWHESPYESYKLKVHCVPAADVTALRASTDYDSVGWAVQASADCASGMKPLNGGTVHVGGDSGAVTIFPFPTATGWASTTLSLSTGFIMTTVICVPTSDPTVTMSGPSGATSATAVTWGWSVNDPAASSGFAVSSQCTFQHGGTASGPAPCTSPVSLSGLADGYHSIQVKATTSDGRIGWGGTSVFVDTTDPTVSFDDPADTVHATASPSIGLRVTDATTVGSLSCWVDSAAPAACVGPTADYRTHWSVPLDGLTDGPHVLHVQATDQVGNVGTNQLPFVVDTTAPTVTMTRPVPPFQLALSTTAAWSGSEAGSGIAGYSVRWQRAPYNAGFGSWSTPLSLDGTTTSTSFGSLLPGSTYCYTADARDHAGNTSAWAAARCTAVPLDDRALTRRGTWTASTPSGWFRTTAVSTKAQGATLSRTGAVLKRVALTALACSTCGVVDLYVGSVRVGRINLAASTTRRKTFTLPAFSLRSGTVTVKVVSSGRLVRVDALGISRM